MGQVALNVKDLQVMERFYGSVIGLEVLSKAEGIASLGRGTVPILQLHHTPALRQPFPGDAGLYHLAIVFSSRGGLVAALQRVFAETPELFSGSADHLVSEAFYLSDPEGNGVELYYDRDPSTWQWQNGSVKMASLYISPQDYIMAYAQEHPEDDMAKIGHVHLKVGSIEQALKFYAETVGFSVTAMWHSALFISVNGYHHHLGMNTWESEVASPRKETLGLRSFELILPSQADVSALQKRLENEKIVVLATTAGITFADPWKNQVVVSAK